MQPTMDSPTMERSAFVVNYTPVALATRSAQKWRSFISRLVGVAISIGMAVLLWWLFRPIGFWFLMFLIAAVVVNLVLAGFALGQHLRARKAVGRVPRGPVLSIERPGLVLDHEGQPEYLDWSRVRAIRGRARWQTPGPQLQVVRTDGSMWSVPFVLLDVLPGSVDGGIRAYSDGRFGLDMAQCDDIW